MKEEQTNGKGITMRKLLFLAIFTIFMNGCNEELVNSTLTVEPTISADTLNSDTSYMWLDTTKGEYHIVGKDTFAIYTYHTNGMSAMLRIFYIDPVYEDDLPTQIIYQDAKGIPRAIMRNRLDSWLCVDIQYMDSLIQRSRSRNEYVETYYQAIFSVGFDRFRVATNPIACEAISY